MNACAILEAVARIHESPEALHPQEWRKLLDWRGALTLTQIAPALRFSRTRT